MYKEVNRLHLLLTLLLLVGLNNWTCGIGCGYTCDIYLYIEPYTYDLLLSLKTPPFLLS